MTFKKTADLENAMVFVFAFVSTYNNCHRKVLWSLSVPCNAKTRTAELNIRICKYYVEEGYIFRQEI